MSQDRVSDFYEVMRGGPPSSREAWDYFCEEQAEFTLALLKGELTDIAKEAADVLFTLCGICESLGIDLDRAFELVAASNMTKTPNFTGKITKGPDYVAPDMSGAVK